MKNVLLLLVLLLGEQAAGQKLNWVHQWGDTVTNCSAMAYDHGFVYSIGSFESTIDLDSGINSHTIASLGGRDMFVIKLDTSGNFIWAARLGGAGGDYPQKIVVDPSGNIFVTGFFSDTVDFDPGPGTHTLASNGDGDVFLWKLSAAGNFIWAIRAGGSGFDVATELAVDNVGDVYCAGYYVDTVDFDPGPGITLLSDTNGRFVCKYSTNGALLWANSYTDLYPRALVCDAAHNVYFAGTYGTNIDIDPGPGSYYLFSQGYYNYLHTMFITKLNPSGTFAWALSIGNWSGEELMDLTLDNSGNIYFTGNFTGALDFDPGPGAQYLTAMGPNGDVFICKLDPSGNYLFAKQFAITSGVTNSMGQRIVVDAGNNIYTAGFYGIGTIDMDPSPLTTFSLTSITTVLFISKLNALGNFVWAEQIEQMTFSGATALVCDPSNNIYLGGSFLTNVNFNPALSPLYQLQPNRLEDAYVLKLSPYCLAPPIPLNSTPAANLLICSGYGTTLTATGEGMLSWTSTFPPTNVLLANGNTFVFPPEPVGTYTFYVEASTCTTSIAKANIVLKIDYCDGIKENSSEGILVYPNPAHDTFFISNAGSSKFCVYNTTGQLVLSGIIEQEKGSVDISQLPTGLFLLELKNDSGVQVARLLKE